MNICLNIKLYNQQASRCKAAFINPRHASSQKCVIVLMCSIFNNVHGKFSLYRRPMIVTLIRVAIEKIETLTLTFINDVA